MMNKRSILSTGLLMGLFLTSAAAEVKVTPVANLDLLGGQYWVTGSAPVSFGGNLNIFFSPVVNFDQNTALLPIYSGGYSATKDVRELVGGGTLTRELQDHSLNFKFVHKLASGMKLKANTGYRMEYLKETVDESWGKGLFDSARATVGLQAEKPYESWNLRAGLDYYTMHYPNYQSLITKPEFQTSLDTATNVELSNQAGTDVLDYNTVAVFFEGARVLSKDFSGLLRYNLALKNFSDQGTVMSSGEFSKTLRLDTVHYLTAGLNFQSPRITLIFEDTAQLYDSNQNSLDVVNNKYTADYYDFIENSFSPNIVFRLGSGEKPIKLSLFWDLTYRVYAERLAQSADSALKADKITQVTNTTGIGFTYPISGGLSAKFSANYSDSVSNMKYEDNYKYNYYTLNYLIGITWEL